MNGLTPPPDGDQNRGPRVIAVYWAFFGVGLAVYSMRIYSRIKIHALGWDDWIMGIALLLFLILTAIGTEMILAGGCRHLYYVALDKGVEGVITVTKLWYIVQPFAFMSVALARISVAALILRIIGRSRWRKAFLYFSIVSTLVINILNIILTFTACSPSEALWNVTIQGKCWNPNVTNDFAIFTSSILLWNVFIDICLALLPITIFWTLKLNLKKRLGLCILMSMGTFAAISGAIKASKISESTETDFTWTLYPLFIWNAVETFLIIISGCIPTLKPLYDKLFNNCRRQSISATYVNSKQRSYPSTSRQRKNGFESPLTMLTDQVSKSSESDREETSYQMQVHNHSDSGSDADIARIRNDNLAAENREDELRYDVV